MRDARDDWRHFDAGAIPSKQSTPHLDAFLDEATNEAAGVPPRSRRLVTCGAPALVLLPGAG